MPNLSIRMSDDEIETLDDLVVSVRAYYEHMAHAMPLAQRLANEVTRSSALRDLLLAWKRGEANALFERNLTAPIDD